ncbi:hypothetical protein HDU97_002780 [Phlyctochytrium planicorne]|nr:hypothetical protein HDU97_002780 [Phlyctochytrium planicorne]
MIVRILVASLAIAATAQNTFSSIRSSSLTSTATVSDTLLPTTTTAQETQSASVVPTKYPDYYRPAPNADTYWAPYLLNKTANAFVGYQVTAIDGKDPVLFKNMPADTVDSRESPTAASTTPASSGAEHQFGGSMDSFGGWRMASQFRNILHHLLRELLSAVVASGSGISQPWYSDRYHHGKDSEFESDDWIPNGEKPNRIHAAMKRMGHPANMFMPFPAETKESLNQMRERADREGSRLADAYKAKQSFMLGSTSGDLIAAKNVSTDKFLSFEMTDDPTVGLFVLTIFAPSLSSHGGTLQVAIKAMTEFLAAGFNALKKAGATKLLIDYFNGETDTEMYDIILNDSTKALAKTGLFNQTISDGDTGSNAKTRTRGGVTGQNSAIFSSGCPSTFNLPGSSPFPLEDIAIVSDGFCGSACAMFVKNLNDNWGVRTYVYGGSDGKPFAATSFNGGFVASFQKMASIDSTGLGRDALSHEERAVMPIPISFPTSGSLIMTEGYTLNGPGGENVPAEWLYAGVINLFKDAPTTIKGGQVPKVPYKATFMGYVDHHWSVFAGGAIVRRHLKRKKESERKVPKYKIEKLGSEFIESMKETHQKIHPGIPREGEGIANSTSYGVRQMNGGQPYYPGMAPGQQPMQQRGVVQPGMTNLGTQGMQYCYQPAGMTMQQPQQTMMMQQQPAVGMMTMQQPQQTMLVHQNGIIYQVPVQAGGVMYQPTGTMMAPMQMQQQATIFPKTVLSANNQVTSTAIPQSSTYTQPLSQPNPSTKQSRSESKTSNSYKAQLQQIQGQTQQSSIQKPYRDNQLQSTRSTSYNDKRKQQQATPHAQKSSSTLSPLARQTLESTTNNSRSPSGSEFCYKPPGSSAYQNIGTGSYPGGDRESYSQPAKDYGSSSRGRDEPIQKAPDALKPPTWTTSMR